MSLGCLIERYGEKIIIQSNPKDAQGFGRSGAKREVFGYIEDGSLKDRVTPAGLILYTQEAIKIGEYFTWSDKKFMIKKKIKRYKYLVTEVKK